MRILMISDVYFPRINGVSTSIQTFRRGLHAAGHETILIAPEYPGAAADSEHGILRVPSRYLPRDPGRPRDEARRDPRAAPAARAAGAGPRAHPDSVHRALPGHGTRARAARAGHRDLSHVLRRVPASLRAADAARRSCDSLRAASPFPSATCSMRSSCLRARWSRRCTTTACDVRCTSSRPAWRWSASPAATAIAFARSSASRRASRRWCTSGASRTKRTSSSCFACSRTSCAASPDAVFVVAGEGPALASLQVVRATRSGSTQHVRFVGYLSRERELLDCYRAGDLFVFSSKTETQGLVLLEVDGARRAGRLDGAHGHGRHRQAAARRARGPRRRGRVREHRRASCSNDPPRRAAMSAEARAYAATWSAERHGRPAGGSVLGRRRPGIAGTRPYRSPYNTPYTL